MKENVINFKTTLIGVVAVINGLVTSKFGAFTYLLYLVIGLMIMDLITRVYAAGARSDEKPESKKVWQGIYRKLGLGLLIIFCLILDAGVMQIAAVANIEIVTKIIFTALILAWIFVREAISIIENLQHAGIELPNFIMKAMEIGKKKVEDIGDGLLNGGEKQ